MEVLKGMTPDAREKLLEHLADSVGEVSPVDVRPMTPDHLKRLVDAGHEVASHGTGHNVLTTLDDAALSAELVESRARLAEWLGAPPTGLAYPNGNHDARVRAAARRAGYEWACSTSAGVHHQGGDPLAIPRRDVTPHSVLGAHGRHDRVAFRAEVTGLRDAWRRLSSAG
jgi:peptidoglycan/xylan/chitin deacetylase (PgdA/CDA1 family)